MAFDIKSTIQAIHSKVQAGGRVNFTQVGEPKQAPTQRLSAAIFMNSATVVGSVLDATIELHVVTIRLYTNMLQEPQADIEYHLSQAVQDIAADLLGDYDLGVTIRSIDAMGQYGQSLSATWGYVELGGKMLRLVDLDVPLIVDGSASFTQ